MPEWLQLICLVILGLAIGRVIRGKFGAGG
jgi:hypothetical protein